MTTTTPNFAAIAAKITRDPKWARAIQVRAERTFEEGGIFSDICTGEGADGRAEALLEGWHSALKYAPHLYRAAHSEDFE